MNCRNSNPCGFSACGALGLITSVIFGVIVSILLATDVIPFILASVWIDLGLGVLTLIFLFIGVDIASVNQRSPLYKSLRGEINWLLSGTIGTILSALSLVTVAETIGTIPLIVLVGIDAFFLSLMVIGWISLLNSTLYPREEAFAEPPRAERG